MQRLTPRGRCSWGPEERLALLHRAPHHHMAVHRGVDGTPAPALPFACLHKCAPTLPPGLPRKTPRQPPFGVLRPPQTPLAPRPSANPCGAVCTCSLTRARCTARMLEHNVQGVLECTLEGHDRWQMSKRRVTGCIQLSVRQFRHNNGWSALRHSSNLALKNARVRCVLGVCIKKM